MRSYFTLTGQRFHLDNLSPQEFSAVDQILDVDSSKGSDDEYLGAARRIIRETFPTYGASARVLSGAVGAIYRDLWYQRQLKRAGERAGSGEADRILKNIRAHPARIIHDAFLDTGTSQSEFARQMRLSRSALSKLVGCFTLRTHGKPSEPTFRMSKIKETLTRLAISPHGVYFDQPSPRSKEPKETSAAPTLRERLLLRTIIGSIKNLREGDPALAVDSLAKELSRLFNDIHVQFLDALVKAVVAAAREVSELAEYDIHVLLCDGRGESLLSEDTERSVRLFGKWKEITKADLNIPQKLSHPELQSQTPSDLEPREKSPPISLRKEKISNELDRGGRRLYVSAFGKRVASPYRTTMRP